MKRLLITGAGGNLGKICREGLKGYADVMRLSDISPMDRRPERGSRAMRSV